MSEMVFHASLAFSTSAPVLIAFGRAPELAFIAAIISVLMDLDACLSPSPKHENALHSPWTLAIALMLPPVASLVSSDIVLSALPAIAMTSHMLQDVLSGETDLGDGAAAFVFMPRLARTIDVTGLFLAFAIMLV